MKLDDLDMDELIAAMEDHDYENIYYLDLTSGEVLMFGDAMVTGVEPPEDIDDNPDRYLPIERVSSEEAYEIMERFVSGLKKGKAAARLEQALSEDRPFRKFRKNLDAFPELKERWLEFYDAEMARLASAWLEDNGIEWKPEAYK